MAPSLPPAAAAAGLPLPSDDRLLLAKLFLLAYSPYLAPFLLFLSLFLLYSSLHIPALHALSLHSLCIDFLLLFSPFIPTFFLLFITTQPPPCFLVDFACFKSLDEYKLSTEVSEYMGRTSGKYSLKTMLFQVKVWLKSGIGDETYGPPSFFHAEDRTPTLAAAHEEMDLFMFGALDELLSKTHLHPALIDILIVNVSTFYPSPSLSSRLINHYKMREDVKSFNISGMGCASGMVALDLAKDLLRVHRNKHVVIVGSENITLNCYYGNEKPMLIPNCLFRCGSYALLLSNKREDKVHAKFELIQSIRTTTAASDKSYNVIVAKEDEEGILGTFLSVNLLRVASHALTLSMRKLVPYHMPFSELLKVIMNTVQRTALKMDMEPYMPDFKKAFTHFCIHPGGRAVIDGIGKNLGLTQYDVEPSKMALHRFGNTSSSGLWYAMAYCEAKERLKKGDKVWQVALGSGFKCISVVWRVLKDVKPMHGFNPWLECIHRYPVEIPSTITPKHPHYEMLKKLEEQVEEEEEKSKQNA